MTAITNVCLQKSISINLEGGAMKMQTPIIIIDDEEQGGMCNYRLDKLSQMSVFCV